MKKFDLINSLEEVRIDNGMNYDEILVYFEETNIIPESIIEDFNENISDYNDDYDLYDNFSRDLYFSYLQGLEEFYLEEILNLLRKE